MKRLLILLFLSALLFLCACGGETASTSPSLPPAGETNTDNHDMQESETMELTKEYLIAHSNLTEEDLNGLDFDDFVAFFELTPEMLEKYDAKALLRMYLEELQKAPTTDYTELFTHAAGKLTEQDLDGIRVMIWEYHESDYNAFMVIDLEKGKVYQGLGNSLDAVDESSFAADWKEGDEVFLREVLTASGITAWNNEYIGTSEGTTGHLAWAIGFRLADGRCVSYRGRGVLNSGTPDTMEPLLKTLQEHFTA